MLPQEFCGNAVDYIHSKVNGILNCNGRCMVYLHVYYQRVEKVPYSDETELY